MTQSAHVTFRGGVAFAGPDRQPLEGTAMLGTRLGDRMKPMSKAVVPAAKVTTRALTVAATSVAFSAQTGTLWNSAKVGYLSGRPVAADPANEFAGGVSKTTGALNVTAMHPHFIVEDDRFSVMFQTAGVVDVQCYIDGEPLWADPQTTPTANFYFLDVIFAAAGTYEVVVMLGNAVFVQVVHNAFATIAPGGKRFMLGLDGDSYADAGQAPYFGGLGAELLARTGFSIAHFGQGSTGWNAQKNDPNPQLRSVYGSPTRVAAWAAQPIDAMLVLGSLNSGDQQPRVVADELEAYAEKLDSVHPGIPLIVAGVEPYNIGTSQAQIDNNNAMREKCEELGIDFIDWFGEAWMTGVSVFGVPGGTGTQQRLIGADGLHLGLAGARLVGQRFADRLAELVFPLR